MAVRFFNDTGPDGQDRLLIGTSYDEQPLPPGQLREAVRPATDEDLVTYAAEYQTYQESFTAPGQHDRPAAAAPPAEPRDSTRNHKRGGDTG